MVTLEKSPGAGLLPTPEARNQEGYQVAGGKKYPRLGKYISSPEAFPVNLLAQRENAGAQKTTVISGRKCCELLKNSSPLGLLARMLLESSQWHSNKVILKWDVKPIYSAIKQIRIQNLAEELSTELLQTLSKSAIPSSRLLFQLVPSTLHTEETGSGLLRTPDTGMDRGPRTKENLKNRYLIRKMPLNINDQIAMMEKGLLLTPTVTNIEGGEGRYEKRKKYRESIGRHYVPGGLAEQIKMLPTPASADATMGAVIGKEDKFRVLPSGRMRKINKNGVDGSIGLAREIALCPTPRMNDYKGASRQTVKKGRNPMTNSCMDAVENGIGTGLKLQPAFVEWMMGYPANWTNLSSPKLGIELSA
jgi:hypothetical protein